MQIINFKRNAHGSTVVATFEVYIPALQATLRQLKLIQSKKGSNFVSLPSFKQDNEEGKPIYRPYLDFSKDRLEAFLKEIYHLLKEHTGESLA